MSKAIESYINSIKNKPFQWGEHDCYTFVYECLQILYPGNGLPDLRRQYSTWEEAGGLFGQYSWITSLERVFRIQTIKSGQALKDYDLLLTKQDQFECIHLKHHDSFYSVYQGAKLIGYPSRIIYFAKNSQVIRLLGTIK